MRFTQLFCVLLAVHAAAHTGHASAANVADWRHDIDEIVKEVVLTHPEPFAKIGRLRFLREVDELKTDLPGLTQEQRAVRAMRLVASLGDSHTQLEPASQSFGNWYPIRIYEFSDGIYIVSAYKTVSELAGAQVLEVARKPAVEVVNAARSLMGADNDFGFNENVYPFHNAALMRGLGFAQSDGSLKMKVRLHDGRIVERVLQAQLANSDIYDPGYSGFDWRFYNLVFGTPIGKLADWTTAYKGLSTQDFLAPDARRPPFLYYRGAFSKQALTHQDAYFIQLNIIQNGKENLRTFFEQAMLEVDQLKPKDLIIDLRNSPGGDGSNVEPILREFTSRRSAPPWKNLYVLVSRRTLSATILLLDALVKHLDLTIIGEPAGAAKNWNADAAGFDLSRTGFHLEVSARHHQLGESSDVKAFVPVDVAAPFSFADFAAGRDPALDPVLHGEEMRAIAVIARADGGSAARRAYLARKQKSANDTTWAAPSEPELRQAGKALEDQKRIADAIETYRFSSEIHPDEWRSWYNLAEAQSRAQLTQDAIESYRKCLALNDPTNFNRERLEKLVADADASKEKPR